MDLALQYFKRTIWLQQFKYTAAAQVWFAIGFTSNMVKSEKLHSVYINIVLHNTVI